MDGNFEQCCFLDDVDESFVDAKIENLDFNVLALILGYLEFEEIMAIRLVNRVLFRASKHPLLWRKMVWRDDLDLDRLRLIVSGKNSWPIRRIIFPSGNFHASKVSRLFQNCEYRLTAIEFGLVHEFHESITDNFMSTIAQLKNLKEIQLSTHVTVTDLGIKHVLQSCKQLEVLKLDHCVGLTGKSVTAIRKYCNNLNYLSLQYGPTCDLWDLLSFLQHCPKLKTLALSLKLEAESDPSPSIDDGCDEMSRWVSIPRKFPDISKSIGLSSNLQELSLRGWGNMTASHLSAISSLQKLKKLSINCSGGSTTVLYPIIESSTLEMLSLTHIDILECLVVNCPSVKTLHFETISSLEKINFHVPKLEELTIRSCSLSSINLEGLLLSPNLQVCEFTDVSGFDYMHSNNSSLTRCNLFMCPSVKEVHLQCPSLTHFSIDVCPEVQNISLDCPNSTHVSLFTLPSQNPSRLTHLRISSLQLKNLNLQHCVHLSHTNLRCQNLSSLNMSNCRNLTKLDLACPTMQKLALSAQRIAIDEILIHLLSSYCSDLAYLSISNCPSLKNEILTQIGSKFKKLSALIIENCPKISQVKLSNTCLKGLKVLHCPNLSGMDVNCPSLSKLYISSALVDDLELSKLDSSINLQEIHLVSCINLIEPELKMPNVRYLLMDRCRNVEKLTVTSPVFKNLQLINCLRCKTLELTKAATVQLLYQSKFIQDKHFENFGASFSNQVTTLCLQDCSSLKNLNIRLPSLQLLVISSCVSLRQFFVYSDKLTRIRCFKCPRVQFRTLEEIASHPKHLAAVEIKGCPNVTICPNNHTS